jgi:energy-coupling factor transporter transmembrane protein EcfT
MTRASRSRLNPATRLVLLAVATGLVLATRSLSVLAAVSLAVLVLLAAGGATPLFQRLRLIAPMAGLVLLMGWGFFDAPTGATLGLRVFCLLGVSAACFAAVSPEETGAALAALRVPRAPAFVLTAGLRYVPLVRARLQAIRDAQQARGIDLRPRARNLGNWMALLLPLLAQSLLLADELALAMESRGFASLRRRPRPLPRPGAWDWVARAAALLVASVVLYGEFGG